MPEQLIRRLRRDGPGSSTLVILLLVVSCAAPSAQISITGTAGRFGEPDFDQYSSVFFDASVESIVLDTLERAAIQKLGLDPDNAQDYALAAFVLRGFHYRFYASASAGRQCDLGAYVYNLDGARVGDEIPILDGTPLERIKRSEEVGPLLHQLFDPIRQSLAPAALVALAPDRASESLWRRIFINAFAEKVFFADSGTLRLTRVQDAGGAELDVIRMPVGGLARLDFRITAERDGSPWKITQNFVPVQVSPAPSQGPQ